MIDKEYIAYCVLCKSKVSVEEPVISIISGTKGSRDVVRGKCSKCGAKVCAILKSKKNNDTNDK